MESNIAEQTPLISLKQAVKVYSHIKALNHIDLDIYKGKSVAIFGHNGAGKSTLLKVLSMQCPLTSGSLFYNNISYNKINDSFRKNFGIISHQSFLYSGLSALENLKFYGSLYNVCDVEKRALELLKQLDLYKRKDDLIRTFSRGMLQRVSIARALIHSPEIIFLDEPYTGLDNFAALKLSNILKEQLSDDKTVIMVTHDVDTGFYIADDVFILEKGRLVCGSDKSLINIDDFNKLYMQHLAKGA